MTWGPRPTSSSAMMRSSSSSSLMAEAMIGGVEAGRATSDTVRRSFTWGFCTSSSSDSAFCKARASLDQALPASSSPPRSYPFQTISHLPTQLRIIYQAPSHGGSTSQKQGRHQPASFFPSTSSEGGDHSRGSPEVLSGIPPTQPHVPVPYTRWGVVP